MDAKLFLRQLKKLDYMIENKTIERNQWKSIATSTTAQMCGERVQTSGSKQKMADAVGIYMDIEREVDEYIDMLVAKKKDIISVIEQLDAGEYDIMHKRYVQYLTIEEIAACKNKTPSSIKGTHRAALGKVQKILDERERKKHG